MKIAIIGSGISGLTCAHHLYMKHDIKIFEKNAYIGGHSNTVDVFENNKCIPIDTGFIVFNDWTYPNFGNLISKLGIKIRNSEMSFSAKCEATGFEWCGNGIKGLALNKDNWHQFKSYQILYDFFKFNRLGKTLIRENHTSITLGDFLQQNNFSNTFINYYILPMGAAIWSSSTEDIYSYPAHSFLSFFENHGLLNVNHRPQWKTIVGGAREYVHALSKPFSKNIELNSVIQKIERKHGKIIIHRNNNITEVFDHVIMACHSDEALKLLSQPSIEEKHTLSAIKYQHNEAVLHTDSSLMPANRNAWCSWNYFIPRCETDNAKVTYYMNKLQPLNTNNDYFVTLNLTDRINKDHIIRKISYQHPVFDNAAISAQSNKSQLNGNQNTWYCGAYWRNGFHEDGVWSAITTIEQFNNEVEYAQLHLQRAS